MGSYLENKVDETRQLPHHPLETSSHWRPCANGHCNL